MAVLGSLAGCAGPWNDAAVYWSDPGQLGPGDADYESVLSNARDAGYTVKEPYYVNSRNPGGIHPEGIAPLDDRFGPDYRVFEFAFYHTPQIVMVFELTGGTSIALFDWRTVMEDFDLESFPPAEWIVERIMLSLEVGRSTAETYAADLREQVVAGTRTPRIDVSDPVTFQNAYAHMEAERTAVEGSETGGNGWYTQRSFRDEVQFADVDFVVQSLAVVHEDGDREYRLKLDRLGGFNLRIELPAGEEIPEAEYRETFRRMFEDVGLDPGHVDELAFEYTRSMW
ncbi:hypothetical protein RH858_01680 [Halalkaliarchaeum sp. AArc-GB]|uniref:hypothetical protein n=1 Tax=Halalkaliarchaeum sp. AArc-GB TaxID=3074078 RepID=UPI0028660F4A|nr:hypothetical protein [Halalkaliarchaeum sp. AArc-GB]MDR5671865.1 hypothetical protein [Halalkaliarchaeum sp. AArc-GB]